MYDLNKSSHQKKNYHSLYNKWSTKNKTLRDRLWEKHGQALDWVSENSKQLMVSSFGSLMLLLTPLSPFLSARPYINNSVLISDAEINAKLIPELGKLLPKKVRTLIPQEENKIASILTNSFGFNVVAKIDKKRLNRTYGLIGEEQHLSRYPGDTMGSHFSKDEDRDRFYSSGMAPGLGAWRHFAYSKDQMTEKDIMREKYYIAVPTFLSDNFLSRVSEYGDFFKFRKMLVINPENGRAIVAVIGDAGPAVWTGKHLGGSPEVMSHLERVDGSERGPVLYFFIEDPNDNISLGPIDIVS